MNRDQVLLLFLCYVGSFQGDPARGGHCQGERGAAGGAQPRPEGGSDHQGQHQHPKVQEGQGPRALAGAGEHRRRRRDRESSGRLGRASAAQGQHAGRRRGRGDQGLVVAEALGPAHEGCQSELDPVLGRKNNYSASQLSMIAPLLVEQDANFVDS